ncbi:hypothetical protein DEU38_103158 [Rhodococcus sp. AG1013]|uniref:hypothetical protein n=1 Tax=Rhodococcus sp. AG1013 TaxID=2183996 RepID=UPI000E0A4065|nr:hypothetical protein [Rhodococcus sp. AG1013]RDI32425.1 hypothetical protein DEU38_103158 [Rhodococcus sp. AG1013]
MPAPDENLSPADAPTEWATADEIPDGTAFASRDHGGRWIREGAGYRYTATDGHPGSLWTTNDLDFIDLAPFIPLEN